MTTNNTFSDTFVQTINKFKQQSNEYDNSQTFESRFNTFKTKFEASWNIHLQEVDDSGMYEMIITMPLHQDVRDEMVKLLATYGFREVVCGKMEKQNDYYFQNNYHQNNTSFFVMKYNKQHHKLAE